MVVVKKSHFQIVALSISLSTAPRVFTKALALGLLKTQGTPVSGNLDELFLKGQSSSLLENNVSFIVHIVERFDWLLAFLKLALLPA